MFSSALSIRQNIKAVDTDLYDYKISNNGRVDVLENFKAGLEGTGDGSIADLQAKHEQQASLITTLETNATTLQSRIDTFNAGLEDGADGTVSTIEQIQLNKTGLAQEITDRGTEIVRLEGLVSTEASTRETNDLANKDKIILEISDRTAEITRVEGLVSTEASNRTAADNALGGRIDQEKIDRNIEIRKLGFCSVAEAEGILVANSFPFSFGMGSLSDENFGLPLPFNGNLMRVALTSLSTDLNPEVSFTIINYPFDNSAAVVVLPTTTISGKSGIVNIGTRTGKPGNLVVKVVSVAGIVDDNAKFRMSFFYTSEDEF